MSILIKGVKKPKECYCCHCSTINMNGKWGKCNLLGRDYSSYPHGIYEDCPLVDIPPHGRLIDADRLLQDVSSATDHVRFTTINNLDYENAFEAVAEFIAFAPTVIESEEE